jgi:hypothetical protein
MPTDLTPKYPTTSTDGSAENAADKKSDKKEEKKFDRFRPEMPSIPGVNNAAVRPPAQPPASARVAPSTVDMRRFAQIGGMIAAIVIVGVGILLWIRHASRTPVESAADESVAAESSAADLPPLPATAQPHEGPNVAATVDQLSKPWSSNKFTFVKPATNESVDAMVIRLPGGALWAFALREPSGRCDLEFVSNLGEIERKYGYHATHPMAVSPCNSTVYDPLKVGPIGGNTWARGEIVQGTGIRPPISIDVQVHGKSIIADGIE